MDDRKKTSKAAFNQQAPSYDNDMRGQHARSLYPALLKRLSQIPFYSALDLGWGTGEMMKRILEEDSSKQLYGIDLSDEMLAVARKKLPEQAKLLLGDSESLPFLERSFDVVYCNDSFHHYPAPENVLGEIHRVLKPGGVFLMGDCWLPFAGRVVMNFYMRHSKEGDVKIYSKEEIITMLLKYFHDVSWERIGSTSCMASGVK